MLLDIARTQPDPEVRGIAVHRLGQTNDESVIDELMKIYETERDGDVKGQVLHAFAQMNSPRALRQAARSRARRRRRRASTGGDSLDRPAQRAAGLRRPDAALCRANATTTYAARILHAFSQMDDPRAQAKLSEVARTGDSVELRAQAIHWIGQRNGDAVIDELMSIYRADRNEDVRGAVLHALSQT